MKSLSFFTPFLSVDPEREPLRTPFQIGGEMVATDGRILIAVPEKDVVAMIPRRDTDSSRPGNVGALFDIPLGNLQPFVSLDLVFCSREKISCAECGGSGYESFRRCRGCWGTGKHYSRKSPVLIGDRQVSIWYLERIASLPGAEIQPLRPGSLIHAPDDEPMLFRFEGGRGLLMPLRPNPTPKTVKVE